MILSHKFFLSHQSVLRVAPGSSTDTAALTWREIALDPRVPGSGNQERHVLTLKCDGDPIGDAEIQTFKHMIVVHVIASSASRFVVLGPRVVHVRCAYALSLWHTGHHPPRNCDGEGHATRMPDACVMNAVGMRQGCPSPSPLPAPLHNPKKDAG